MHTNSFNTKIASSIFFFFFFIKIHNLMHSKVRYLSFTKFYFVPFSSCLIFSTLTDEIREYL